MRDVMRVSDEKDSKWEVVSEFIGFNESVWDRNFEVLIV